MGVGSHLTRRRAVVDETATDLRVVRVRVGERVVLVETPTVETRFTGTYRDPSTDVPGLVMTDDGVCYLVNPDGTRSPVGTGGGSLPTGWTESGDPANVNTHGGFIIGSDGGTGVMNLSGASLGVNSNDETTGAAITADGGVLSIPGAGTSAFTAIGSAGAMVALDAGGLDIANAGNVDATTGFFDLPADSSFRVVVSSVPALSVGTPDGTAMVVGFFGATPVVQPAAPVTLGDVIAALQALGLVAP
jgi:hypothetical protein